MTASPWQGIRDDDTIVDGEGSLEAQNVSFRVNGELRRRPGLGTRLDLGGVLSSEFTDRAANTYVAFVTTSGEIKTLNLTDASTTTLKSSLSTAYRGQFARSGQRLYYANDFDPVQVIELGNSTALAAGIAAPTSGSGTHQIGAPTSGAGLIQSGTHLVRYRYFNSRSGYYSNPSLALSLAVTGVESITFSIGTGSGSEAIIRSTDAKVDQVIVELTAAGASAYYNVAAANQTLTSVTVSMDDTTIALQVPSSTYGDYGHEQPPLFALITEHRGRIFGWGATVRTITGVNLTLSSTTVTVTGTTFSTGWAGRMLQLTTGTDVYRISSCTGTATLTLSTNYSGSTVTGATIKVYSIGADTLTWTRAGFPEAYKPSEWSRRVLQNATDTPAGLVSYHDVLWLFGQRTMRVLDYPTDPATGSLEQVPTEMGLWNQRCLIQSGGYIYGWGRTGAWVINGLSPQHISRAIDVRLDGTDTTSTVAYDASLSEQFHGYYDPRERCITWAYIKTGDSTVKNHITYDLDRKQWRTGSWRQAMKTTCTVAGTTNDVRVLLSDESGYSWYLTENRFDGVPLGLVDSGSEYTGVITVFSGTALSTSVIPTVETLPTSSTLVGVVLYNPTTSGTSVVSANTATGLTLSPALTATPSAGDSLYLGSFEYKIRTKWVTSEGLENKKRPAYLMIKKVPGTSLGRLRVRIYEDFSTTPMTFTKGISDTEPNGVYITDGLTYCDVDLGNDSDDSSIAVVPLSANWKRAISAEVTSSKPSNQIKLLQVAFLPESSRSEVQDVG
jgi:hypothetical protein